MINLVSDSFIASETYLNSYLTESTFSGTFTLNVSVSPSEYKS